MAEEKFDVTQLWDKTMAQIKDSISETEFNTWFSRLKPASLNENRFVFYVTSQFIKDKFTGDFCDMLETTMSQICGKNIQCEFEIKKFTQNQTSASVQQEKAGLNATSSTKNSAPKSNLTLNSSYTFDSFIPGENSDFAYNACLAISKNPGTTYNPCLIYGGVGLGKTHLLQSIGNAVVSENEKVKVMYVTAENFANEFIQAIKDATTRQFQNKYRKVNILLMDDIQFLQGKDQTQNELFNTFNDLYDSGRQIVFTSDRPVEELKNISDRLRTRFSRGLSIDIQPPKFETRVAILKKKCDEKNVSISDDVIEFIAQNITSNVRALESCITKLIAYNTLLKKEINLESAREQLKQIINSNNDSSGITADLIIKTVAEYFNISPFDIKGKNKNQSIAQPRQVAMYLCHKLTDFSTTEIASAFGDKNHTTVLYHVKKVEALLMSSDSELPKAIDKITSQIKASTKH